ncbi:Uncharacterized membrane protein HdeD, DUF308 family [Shimia gijangensis]|uniref:Uncharacterized membrane protein HdeD, DUF308 family n=1 Tax=Shimia gijangensis TaxID=1470563 RepID=A0A1M6FQN9_9RHOB|nr:DUF308 domain-containing protein [Shimia gijangensis]SHJ00017.1 Uncharacterized membrane protein HdeD, DUF308 family [Shimia gijangensis]
MSNWVILFGIGILGIIAGLMALFNPFGASLVVTAIAGWSFLILGILQIFEGLRAQGWSGKMWSILMGVIAVFLGVNLLGEPLKGMLVLTTLVGIMFLASGLFKLIIGLRIENPQLKWAVMFSGIISAFLGFMVLSNLPQSAATMLGVLLAVELLSNGVSMIALALARKDGAMTDA